MKRKRRVPKLARTLAFDLIALPFILMKKPYRVAPRLSITAAS
jgi:hypothetical protein